MKWISIVITGSIMIAAALLADEQDRSAAAVSSPPRATSNVRAGEPFIQTAESLKWVDAPPRLPPGGKMALLDGDPGKPGSFIARLRMPPGYKIMPHTHPTAEKVTVISGTVFVAIGESMDESASRRLTAGDFAVVPKGIKHSAWTRDEEAVIQTESEGPFEMHYVDPKDDPRDAPK